MAPLDPTKDDGMERCTVAMLVTSRRSTLERILNAVYGQTYDKHLIRIVFAENSFDGSLAILKDFQSAHREEYTGIEILEKVEGIPQARNSCFERATGKFVVFVDDDVVPPADALSRIQRHFQTNPACGLVGLRYLPSSGSTVLERAPLVQRVAVMPGMGCTGIRLTVAKNVGEFDNSLPWAEDLDYVCRTRRSGQKVHLLGPPHAIHLNDGLGVGRSSSLRSDLASAVAPKTFDARLLLRHRLLFLPVVLRKYGPFIAFLIGLAIAPITWVPAAVMTVVALLVLQTAYQGKERLYGPFLFLLSGIASVVGLIRGFSGASNKATTKGRHESGSG